MMQGMWLVMLRDGVAVRVLGAPDWGQSQPHSCMPKSERWLAWGCKSSRVSAWGCTIAELSYLRQCKSLQSGDYVAWGCDMVQFGCLCYIIMYHLVHPSTRHRYVYCLIAVFDPTPPGLDSVLAIPLVCHAMLLSCHATDYDSCWYYDVCCMFAWLLIACCYITCEYIIVLILASHVARPRRGFIFYSSKRIDRVRC